MTGGDTKSQYFGPIWEKILEELDKVNKKYNVPVKLAIVGFAKSGKSTLFNAIYGEDVQEVGAQTDLTMEDRDARRFGVILTDTRGFGTSLVPLQEIKSKIAEDPPHMIIHCINGMGGISEDDAELYEFCKEAGKHVIVVVTKADVMKEREIAEFRRSVQEKLDSSVDPLFVSAETALNMTILVKKVVSLLPEAARDAFIAKQRVDFQAKRNKSRAAIQTTALAAAGVAVSPIPVSDVLILIPMQAGMVAAIGKLWGYEMSAARVKEIITVAGGGIVLRYAFQVLVKFLPAAGSIIGPVIAYGGTVALGEAALRYFESGMKATPEEIAKVYKQAKEKAEHGFKTSGREDKIEQHKDELEQLRRQLERGGITQEEYERRVEELLG